MTAIYYELLPNSPGLWPSGVSDPVVYLLFSSSSLIVVRSQGALDSEASPPIVP